MRVGVSVCEKEFLSTNKKSANFLSISFTIICFTDERLRDKIDRWEELKNSAALIYSTRSRFPRADVQLAARAADSWVHHYYSWHMHLCLHVYEQEMDSSVCLLSWCKCHLCGHQWWMQSCDWTIICGAHFCLSVCPNAHARIPNIRRKGLCVTCKNHRCSV